MMFPALKMQDFMFANWAHWANWAHELLGGVSNQIIIEVRGVNRVVYDISGKPPVRIGW